MYHALHRNLHELLIQISAGFSIPHKSTTPNKRHMQMLCHGHEGDISLYYPLYIQNNIFNQFYIPLFVATFAGSLSAMSLVDAAFDLLDKALEIRVEEGQADDGKGCVSTAVSPQLEAYAENPASFPLLDFQDLGPRAASFNVLTQPQMPLPLMMTVCLFSPLILLVSYSFFFFIPALSVLVLTLARIYSVAFTVLLGGFKPPDWQSLAKEHCV